MSTYADANHHPADVLNGLSTGQTLEITADAGFKVQFDVSGSEDFDGNALSYYLFFYDEPRTYTVIRLHA